MSDRIRSAGVAGPAAADGPLQCAAVRIAGQQLSVAATRRTLTRIEDLFSGHLPAPIELLSQAVAPHMQQQGSGTIVRESP
jgi:3-methyladenine DNA glycosylase/8-oxoguanine DNA glycosylase